MATGDKDNRASHHLITVFFHGEVFRYTDQAEDIGQYRSFPQIEIETPTLRGSLEPEPWTIRLPKDALAALLLEDGFQPPAFIVVQEINLDESLQNPEGGVLCAGLAATVIENADGRREWVKYRVSNDKEILASNPSLRLTELCSNPLYGRGCLVSKLAHTRQAVLDAFDPVSRMATITGFSVPSSDLYFTMGHISRGGTLVDVRYWHSDSPSTFHTTTLIPPSWVGQPVQIVAGCLRTFEVCQITFNNTSQWNGSGIATPNYDPMFHSGAAGPL